MKREALLEKLREIYRSGDMSEFKRVYLLGAFILNDEDKRKIDLAIATKKAENAAKVSEAAALLGGVVID